jgi:putative Mn2+ efflux pump MntP
MEVIYTLTEADYLRAMAHAENGCRNDLNRPLYMKVLLGATSVAFALAILSVIGLYQKYGASAFRTDLNWFFGFLLLGIVGFLAYVFRFRALSRKTRLGDLGHFPIKQRITVSDEGICFDGKYGTANCEWKAVKSIEDIPEFTVITLLSWATVLVPNSAFSSLEEQRQFMQFVHLKLSGLEHQQA